MGQKSLRQILTSVTFIGLIPMALLLVLLVYRGQLAARESAVANLKALTAAMSTQFDLLISDAEFQLESLNGIDQIASGDSAICNAWMANNVIKKPGVSAWYRLAPDGTVTCSSFSKAVDRVPQAAIRLDDPSVYDSIKMTPVIKGSGPEKDVIAIRKAYWNNGDPYQIVITLDAKWFYDAVRKFVPMEDRKLFIIDDVGQIILQLPEYKQASAKRAPTFKGLVSLSQAPLVHTVEVGVGGAERVVASMIMHTFQDGKTLSLSMSGSPKSLFFQAHSFIALGLGTLVLGVFGVMLAQKLLFQRYIARPMGAIVDYAQTAQTSGKAARLTLPRHAPADMSDLAAAIAKMSGDSAQRAEALSEALANLERAEGIAQMGHWRLDLKTDELLWSDGVYTLHGLDRDTFTPTLENAIEMYHPDDRATVQLATEDSIETGEPYEFEKRIIRGDGSYIYVGARGQISYDDEGLPAAMFGIVIDVDAPKQAQRQLQRAQVAAQQLADARASFLETVTHEVRTPLTAMLGIVDGFGKTDLSDDQLEQVDLLHASGQLLMNVICDLLDSASVDAGVIRLAEEKAAPQAIIQSCFDTFKTAYTSPNIEFYHETKGQEPVDILLDPQRLRQIIFNILGNAVKHTSEGRIGIETTYSDASFSIAIRDTGPGIAVSQQHRIFDRFVEGVSAPQGQTVGTGLGLHIVKTLATKMGGNVRVASQRGMGSCFTVTLPYRKQTAAAALGIAGDAVPGPQKQGDILVVEDNPVNQKLLTAFLKRAGFSCVVHNDGQYAMEWLLSRPAGALPPLALIDVNMPRMNGIELCEFVRKQLPGGEAMPLYLVTADVLAGYDSEIKRLKIDGSVSKPIDFGALQTIVETFVSKDEVETAA